MNHNFTNLYFGDSNVLLAQVPSSWGVIFEGRTLREFLENFTQVENNNRIKLPDRVKIWPESLKKVLYKYLINENLYFSYFEKSYVSITDEVENKKEEETS